MGNGLTPIQQKMVDLLSDGLCHTKEELHGCLYDDQGPLRNIAQHITMARKLLRPTGRDIICQREGKSKSYYRLVRLTASPYEG
jgi:hypothetical protein